MAKSRAREIPEPAERESAVARQSEELAKAGGEKEIRTPGTFLPSGFQDGVDRFFDRVHETF